MKETPAAFTRRTSIAYAPPAHIRVVARPLAPGEPCPTLFRYPGPCGLADFFAGGLAALGPHDLAWMSARTWFEDSVGARRFGTLAILQPLRLQPGRFRRGIYAGDNRPLDEGDEIVWLPPSLVDARLPWDDLATAAAARARIDARERPLVVDDLCAYLEELDALRASGLPGPGVPWLTVPLAERRRLLAVAGVPGAWTDRVSSAA
jgi:hypothetical protein